MCGRTACNLNKNTIIKACTYKTKDGKNIAPNWLDVNKGCQYHPSYNTAPGSYTPVLVKRSGIDNESSEEEETGERLLCPMKWGLVPSWHRGPVGEFGLKTNNCRVEGITQKPTYRGPLQKGRRCVILAEGFFEWKAEKGGKKQPYYIYFPQPNGINMEDRFWESEYDDCLYSEKNDWEGPRLLTMAGLYDVCSSQKDDLYSYTVITVPSSPKISWLHTRMPAILDGDDAVYKWLDHENVSFSEAVKLLMPITNLEWHAVSTFVNSSSNNTVECVLPLKEEKIKKTLVKETFLTNWLKGSNKKNKLEEELPVSSPKRPKKEK